MINKFVEIVSSALSNSFLHYNRQKTCSRTMICRGDIGAEHKDPENFPYKLMRTAPSSDPGTNLP